MADTADSKSVAGNRVGVQVPPGPFNDLSNLGVMCRRTSFDDSPDSPPRTSSQASSASLLPFDAYPTRSLLPFPRRIVTAPVAMS